MCINLKFNELSINPPFSSKHIAHQKMMEFVKTAKAARDKNINHINSDYSTGDIILFDGYTMHSWLFDKDFQTENRVFREFLQSMIILPFIDEEKEDEYLSQNFYFEDIVNGINKQPCKGLAAAYLYDGLSISFQNGEAWRKDKLSITIENTNSVLSYKTVLNVYSSDCFLNEELIDHIERAFNVRPAESNIPPSEKTAHFSDHHGINELEKFWLKLANNPYVISARSTNWGGKKFIRKIEKNGLIEIVLVNTERKYAMQLETTGKTFYETEFIAKNIEENYS
jgi:hypothetical protein